MSEAATRSSESVDEVDAVSIPMLSIRAGIGGILMGLANLVPGISGGTMLLASGIYPRFIRAISEITTLKFKRRSIVVLGVVAIMAILSIVLFAGAVKSLVVSHRWVMYSLFIGLTLGGVPLVWRMAFGGAASQRRRSRSVETRSRQGRRESGAAAGAKGPIEMAKPANRHVWIGFALGVIPMAVLAYYQMFTPDAATDNESWMMMFIAGIAGASAMILPGVSGGYLLLVLGVYVPILGGIDAFKEGLKAGSWDAMSGPLFDVVVPVGLGVAIGILVVSNVLEKLLAKYEKGTLGGLLGLLVGAVAGLWPFRVGVAPEIGSIWPKTGEPITAELLAEIPPDKYPAEFFAPSGGQIAGALALVVAGFVVTALIARFGGEKQKKAAVA